MPRVFHDEKMIWGRDVFDIKKLPWRASWRAICVLKVVGFFQHRLIKSSFSQRFTWYVKLLKNCNSKKKNCDFFSQRFLCQGMVHPRLSMLQIGHSCSISYCIGAFFPQTFKTSSRQRLTLGCMTLVPGHQNAHKVRHQCHWQRSQKQPKGTQDDISNYRLRWPLSERSCW